MNYDFSLPNVDGQTVSLSDYTDVIGLAVVFTCNHCPYAVAYERRLIALHQHFASQGVPLVLINPNDASQYPQDSFELMKVRSDQRNFPFPYLHDESQEVAKGYGATRTPHVFLLERGVEDWTQVYVGAIDDNYSDENKVEHRYLADAITAMVEGRDARHTATPPVGCSVKWKQA